MKASISTKFQLSLWYICMYLCMRIYVAVHFCLFFFQLFAAPTCTAALPLTPFSPIGSFYPAFENFIRFTCYTFIIIFANFIITNMANKKIKIISTTTCEHFLATRICSLCVFAHFHEAIQAYSLWFMAYVPCQF